MSSDLQIFVLMKQVPDQSAKSGINPDGTIDRARAKRMLNPFDRFALQAALHVKKQYGATVTVISMGPPAALEILLEGIEHGADRGFLLSDRRLAASDTLATAYALHCVIKHLGTPHLIFCGLQTTDGDTAQVGPQIAERLDLPQASYCEDFRLEPNEQGEMQMIARRVIEGGHQWVKMQLPAMITVANSYHPLAYKSIAGTKRVQGLLRDEAEKNRVIQTITLDDVGADPALCGLKGSPTIVAKTDKVAEIGGSCIVQQGEPVDQMVSTLLQKTAISEFLAV
jgi:electron transfer flavoprotein beta subunit